MEENEIATSGSLKEFILYVLDGRDKGLSAGYDEESDRLILRYIFKMDDKKYLGKIPLNRTEALSLAKYILSVIGTEDREVK